MKCILYLLIALLPLGTLYSQVTYTDYSSPATWDAAVRDDGSNGGITTVNTVITRINGTVYTHNNQTFIISDQNTGWITQFNDLFNMGQVGSNIDYFVYQGTNEITTSNTLAGNPPYVTGGNIVFDEVYFNIGGSNTMHISNILRAYTIGNGDTYFGTPPGGITVAKTLHFNNGITTTNRDYPIRGAIVFVNSANYTNTTAPTDAQHVDGYVTEYNSTNSSTGAAGHGGTFTFPVGNGTSIYPLQRSGTYADVGYLLTVGWVDGDPGTTKDLTDADPITFPPPGGSEDGTINSTDQLGSGINSVIPVGFWDWHYQDEVDINNIATAMTEDQTITVSIPDLQEYGDVTASDLRLVGWDAGNGKWINLSSLTPGATGLTKGSTLTGVIEGGTTITALAIGSISRVLPVTFSDFTVKTDGCKAKLQWKTSFEQNNSHFLVEHSTDGIRFSTIGQVSATGNSTTIQTYNYTDNTPAAGANYYRVTQIDFDGKQRSTPIVLVKIKCDASPVVKIYPNPASNTLYIQSSKTVMQVNVLNSGGQPVLKYAPSTHGSGIFDMNIQQLPAGIYMLQIINKDGTIDVSKLMKK
ncbi:MAG: hypothetical protein BGP14_02825 [Sphingobacteriales bacterium 44-15]|nr:MAG: hypothetical protein BGP14_02825 [Sphingobacteriales bacterium 44-15]